MSKVEGLTVLWEKKYGPGRFELVTVPDMAKKGAINNAVKGSLYSNEFRVSCSDRGVLGVSRIAHVAGNLSFDSDPNKPIPETLTGLNGILESATAEPAVKLFVYTSSYTIAAAPIQTMNFKIDENT